ncbi:MAG: hypothetical protein H0W90_04185 [Actinobacteria bacterium]|nr:hypothetical protein [Actinomycetota bacterium]
MSPVIERAVVLERSAARERSLVGASERRLGRLAFDLHDGALQNIAALGTDLFLMQKQLCEIVPEPFKPGDMTPSQKIALIRVVQEALTNIREHANATQVRITIRERGGHVDARIEDDGAGFHVARTLLDSAQRGRLGLVGGSERIRLLGGKFDVRSKPGGPTIVSLSLPRWRPLGIERPQDDAVVPAAAAASELR